MIKIGDSATAELTVLPSDTARMIAVSAEDELPEVFATARMIALMELAAGRLIRPCLETGQLSVGICVNVRHTAATPVGCRVRATATFLGMDGKQFLFNVVACDEAGSIGEGEHSRAIVQTERLLQGAQRRRAQERS